MIEHTHVVMIKNGKDLSTSGCTAWGIVVTPHTTEIHPQFILHALGEQPSLPPILTNFSQHV
jgi:hypothetical protein